MIARNAGLSVYGAAVSALPRRLRRALGALAIAASSTVAQASPADDPATDGQVFAGVTGADPANATTNPAALLRLTPGIHAFSFGTVALEQISIERRLESTTGALSSGPTVDDTTLGGGVTLGFAVASPRRMGALLTSLRPPDETIDDDAVAYHTRGSRTRRIDWATLAGGFSLTSRLYLGLAGTLVDRHQRVSFARDTALDAGRDPARGVDSDCGGAACGLENPAARELWSVDVTPTSLLTTDNLIYTVGVMARLPSGVWAAVAVERPWRLGAFTMAGDATVVRAPRDGGATLRGEAVVIQHLPEVWRAGARGPVAPGWELAGEVRWRRTYRTDPVDVRVFGGELAGTDLPEWNLRPRGLDNAWAADLGLEPIDAGQRWRFGGKLGIDTGVVADDRLSARAPWGKQVTAALGAQLRLDRWVLQLGYRFEAQLPTSADPSAFDPIARLDCVEADHDYDLPACATLRAGYATSGAAGTYGRFTHTARIALRFVLQ